MSEQQNEETTQVANGEKKKRSGRPKGSKNTAKAPASSTGSSKWDLVLTKGKRGQLVLPVDMTKDDVEAIGMQLKPIFESVECAERLATVQAEIAATDADG